MLDEHRLGLTPRILGQKFLERRRDLGVAFHELRCHPAIRVKGRYVVPHQIEQPHIYLPVILGNLRKTGVVVYLVAGRVYYQRDEVLDAPVLRGYDGDDRHAEGPLKSRDVYVYALVLGHVDHIDGNDDGRIQKEQF